ncbi:MAG: NeuD/PglB/VioB family sugar acetyltransferase [Candidatus Solibacter sp.]
MTNPSLSAVLGAVPAADFREFLEESVLQGIHQRIEEQVRLYPGRDALVAKDARYTYAEMNAAANSVAAEILSVAGTELAQAAILQPNTPELIVSILASLKARKAYVPLDPGFPKQRLRDMLEDAQPTVLLTDEKHMGLAGELAGKDVRIINTTGIKRQSDAQNPALPCDPLERAYILYTSGSTGRPKGMAFPHRTLLSGTRAMTNCLFFAPGDRVTWLHSASFAASVVDIYCSLANGAAAYPWDAKTRGFTGLADWLVSEKVTTLQWIPSAFRQFLRTVPEAFVFPNIRLVVMASESLTIREVELFRQHFPVGSYLVNQVGTTETHNYCLYPIDHRTSFEGAVVPGGYPASTHREAVILDDERRRMPAGSPGEIGVKSSYTCSGYWNDDTLTQAKFVSLDNDGVPVYLTGDLGRLDPDGCLIHLGRKDFQVKIRGYRIELAEVELVLATVPGVSDCAAWVVKDRLSQDRLVGYVILGDHAQFDQALVEQTLASRLPEYMVPRHYVLLNSFPSLPTGKVDRNALPNPFTGTEPIRGQGTSASGSLEQQIADLFRELLLLDKIDLDSDFLGAGGDSLLTAVLLQRVHQRHGVEIPNEEFLEAPTPENLARIIRDESVSGARRTRAKAAPVMDVPRVRTLASETQLTSAIIRGAEKSGDSTRIKNLVIISAGSFGREVYLWAAETIDAGAPFRIKGFLDGRRNELDGFDYGAKILGDVESYSIEEDDVFVSAIGEPMDKPRYCVPIIEKGGRFVNVIHRTANIGKTARLGTGIVLGPFASVTADARVGDHVSVGALSNLGHDCVVGDWCQISSHVAVNGRAEVGEGAFIGSQACLIPRVKVGAWSHVGAGSVVVRNVEPYVRVFGNPAAPIGKRSPFKGPL